MLKDQFQIAKGKPRLVESECHCKFVQYGDRFRVTEIGDLLARWFLSRRMATCERALLRELLANSSQQGALRIRDRCSGETIEHLPRSADRVRCERIRIAPRRRSTPVQRASYRQESRGEPDEKSKADEFITMELSKERGCDVPRVNLAILPYSAALEHFCPSAGAGCLETRLTVEKISQQRVGAFRAADLLPLLAEVGYGGKVHVVDRDEQPSRFTSRFTSRLVTDLPIHLPIRT